MGKKPEEEKKNTPVNYTPEDFIKAFSELTKKMGFTFNVEPQFRLRDDSTYSIIISQTVVKLPSK